MASLIEAQSRRAGLWRGTIETTYRGFLHDEDGRVMRDMHGRRIRMPVGYEVANAKGRKPNALACLRCKAAVAQVWKASAGRYMWCDRREGHGSSESRLGAFRDALGWVRRHGWVCECRDEKRAAGSAQP